jgi:F0F1-type ATP synthase membrane subunit c/vacuolar-type H+-ATPase subunit K
MKSLNGRQAVLTAVAIEAVVLLAVVIAILLRP